MQGYKSLAHYEVDQIIYLKFQKDWWPCKISKFTEDGQIHVDYYHDKYRR